MQIAQGNLTTVDGKVYWKGRHVPTETLFLHYDGDTKIIRFEVRDDSGDPSFSSAPKTPGTENSSSKPVSQNP